MTARRRMNMNGLTVLQISVALMTAIATLLLGLSQDNTALASGALFVPLASLIFIDWLGWFSLHRYLAAVLGVSALLYAFFESRQGGVSTQFVSVAILLIHLQWILLLQRKTWRIYWQL